MNASGEQHSHTSYAPWSFISYANKVRKLISVAGQKIYDMPRWAEHAP
jgi:hypothetical protein